MSEPRPKGKDTRIRSEEELAQQGRDLAAVRDVLATRGVTAVLSDGALLGAAREGDFIEWDWDAELFLFHDEVRCLGPQMADDLGAAGFTLLKCDFKKRYWKINATRTPGYNITLRAWYPHGDSYRRERFSLPRHLMEERGEVMLRGEMYEAPADIDGYLSHVYGDWRTPVFSRDLSDYLSDGFYDKKGGRMRAARRRLEELLSRTRRRERRGR